MKKFLIYLLPLLMLAIGGSSCTHYQGPSGDLYGRWHLQSIDADGTETPVLTGEMYWSFQTQVIYVQLSKGEHEFTQCYGVFRLEDNTMFLEFPDATSDLSPAPILKETGLASENILQVLKLTGKEMTLLYNPTPDTSLTYCFRKW